MYRQFNLSLRRLLPRFAVDSGNTETGQCSANRGSHKGIPANPPRESGGGSGLMLHGNLPGIKYHDQKSPLGPLSKFHRDIPSPISRPRRVFTNRPEPAATTANKNRKIRGAECRPARTATVKLQNKCLGIIRHREETSFGQSTTNFSYSKICIMKRLLVCSLKLVCFVAAEATICED